MSVFVVSAAGTVSRGRKAEEGARYLRKSVTPTEVGTQSPERQDS